MSDYDDEIPTTRSDRFSASASIHEQITMKDDKETIYNGACKVCGESIRNCVVKNGKVKCSACQIETVI